MTTEREYAGFLIRFVASVLDSILLMAASWGVTLIGMAFSSLVFGFEWEEMFRPLTLQVINLSIYIIVDGFYYTWTHYQWGTTLGKRVFQVYVVDYESGEALTLWQSFLRWLGYFPSALIFGGGYLMAWVHPEKRALHDFIARTVSIVRRSEA